MFFYRSYRHRRRKRLLTMILLPLLTLFLLLLPFYIIYKPPYLLIRYFQHRWPDVLWQAQLRPNAPPLVALTLDDAPSDETPEILSLLAANDARATFFVIGDHIPGREPILRDLVRAGNELANHAMYDEPSRDRGDDELAAQILAVQSMIQRIYAAVGRGAEAHEHERVEVPSQQPQPGAEAVHNNNNSNNDDDSTDNHNHNHNVEEGEEEEEEEEEGGREMDGISPEGGVAGGVKYFRPGSGFFTERMRALVQQLGYRIVLGSVYPHDPQIAVPWLNAAHILSMVRPGSVIVVHDRRPWTAPMLAKVLPELKRRGYRVGTVTELLKESISS